MNNEPATPSSPGETPLDRLLDRIHLTEEFPSISKYVIELNRKLAADPENSNAADLAKVIVNDHSLTSKLLKMVNSAYYGLAGGKVSTVTRAVVVLGYENVRLATLSLTMFEHFKGRSQAKALKEVVVSSFWSGMMARELAGMDDRVDPEEAFVCAMMSHLGKLVMIHYLPREYQKIIDHMEERGVSELKAIKSISGVTYDELGVAVARQWNFPSQIIDAMQPISRTELKNRKKPPEGLRVVTGFMKALHDTISDSSSIPDAKKLQALLDTFSPHIHLTRKRLKKLVKDSLENVHDHARALSLQVSQSTFLDQLVGIYDPGKMSPGTENGTASKETFLESVPEKCQLLTETPWKEKAGTSEVKKPGDIILEGIQELSQIMMTDYDIDTIATMSLEVFYRALGFQRALMFLRDNNHPGMSVHYGYGSQSQRLIENLHLDLKPSKDLFSLSLTVGKDLIVENSYDKKLDLLIPAWYRDQINSPSFVFFPVVYQNVCLGALYGDHDSMGMPMSEAEHRYVSMLRNQFVLSIKYTHQAA